MGSGHSPIPNDEDLWTFRTPDWADRIRAQRFPLDLSRQSPHLNAKRVAAAERIFGQLRLPDVPGQPEMLDSAPPWLWDIVRLAAGGLGEDGKQRVQTLGVLIAKKNSKTTGIAALTLTLAMMSPRPRAEILLLGAEQSIANLAFNQMIGMIAADEELRSLWHIREHLKRLEHRQSGVTISVKSFSMEAVTGTKPALALIDELHLATHPDAGRVLGQIRGGQASVPEGQLIWLSTQSDVKPRGLWLEELTKARGVRNGTIDLPYYAPVLYEPPPEFMTSIEAASDPKLFELMNPSLGYTVSKDFLLRSFREAVGTTEQEARRWLSQHANVEVAEFSTSENAWGGASVWSRSARQMSFEDVRRKATKQLVIGIDGGGLDDLLAVSILAIDQSDNWFAATRCFAYAVALERRKEIASLLRDFEAQGDLVIMPDASALAMPVELVTELYKGSICPLVASDPSGVMVEMSELLERYGTARNDMLGVRQGWGLRPGFQALERRLRAGTLMHAGQPILDWAVSNSKEENGLITKKASGSAKIDPLIALACAAVGAMDRPAIAFDVTAWIG